MKTTIKRTLLVVVFMLGTFINYANVNGASTFNDDAKRVKIEFSYAKKGHSLTIKDKDGAIIYDEKVKNTGNFSKTFDLTALNNGNYTAELNKDFEIIVKPFNVNSGSVTFLTEKEETVFKPVFRTKENIVMISKIAFNKKPLKVVIFYGENQIFTEIVEGKKVLNRTYSLSKKQKGEYRVVMSTDNRVYVETFKI